MSSTLLPPSELQHQGPSTHATISGDQQHASSAVQALDSIPLSRTLAAFPPRHAQALARQFSRIRQQASALDAATAVQLQCVLAAQREQLQCEQSQALQKQNLEEEQRSADAKSAATSAAAQDGADGQHDSRAETATSTTAPASASGLPVLAAQTMTVQFAAGPGAAAEVPTSAATPMAAQPLLSHPAQLLPSAPTPGVQVSAFLPVITCCRLRPVSNSSASLLIFSNWYVLAARFLTAGDLRRSRRTRRSQSVA